MQIHQIVRKTKNRSKKIVGRGSKRGKTSGRGTKGQNARAGHKNRPEIRDIIKKLPKLRGRGKNTFKSIQNKPVVVNLDQLNEVFLDGAVITPKILLTKGLIGKKSGQVPTVKILSDGTITKKITIIACSVSKSAKEKIIKAGGGVK